MDSEAPIVYCHCAFAQVLSTRVKEGVLQRLIDSGREFECVPDLCEMSARRDPRLAELARQPGTRIAACYPRAVQGLFVAAGAPLPKQGIEIVNMRVLDADQAFEAIIRPDSLEAGSSEKVAS
jgi:hypothetical protein